jgi:hypothetical protein
MDYGKYGNLLAFLYRWTTDVGANHPQNALFFVRWPEGIAFPGSCGNRVMVCLGLGQ